MTRNNNYNRDNHFEADNGLIPQIQNAASMLYMRKNTTSSGKRACPLEGVPEVLLNYKNVRLIKQFISERGKIMPSRITGVSSKKQRLLARAIRQARSLALLPIEGSI
jgi:small subunit ribosomal protein S18